jgi:hypothetical protein
MLYKKKKNPFLFEQVPFLLNDRETDKELHLELKLFLLEKIDICWKIFYKTNKENNPFLFISKEMDEAFHLLF